MNNKLILLKAIGKTGLSILKWLLIISMIIGGILGTVIIGQYLTVVSIIENIIIGILMIILLFLTGEIIVMTTEDNYEIYARKSTLTENIYKINYNMVYGRSRVIQGKTKKRAIENLMKEIGDNKIEADVDCIYKVTKIKEIV